MDIDSIVPLATAYYESNPNIALLGAAAILALAYFRPMIVFKSVLGIGAIAMCAIIFQSLSGTLDTAVHDRDTMLLEKKGD